MKKVFVDTNVLLDVLRHREDFCEASAEIWSLVETGQLAGGISAISFNNVYYIIRRLADHVTAEKSLVLLRDTFEVVSCDQQILNQAIDSGFKDFEDAIQFFSAVRLGADYLLSRNVKDFPPDSMPVMTPEAYLSIDK